MSTATVILSFYAAAVVVWGFSIGFGIANALYNVGDNDD